MKGKLLSIFFVSVFSGIIANAQDVAPNQLDEQGRKTGQWKTYYENGSPKYEGFFHKGNPQGRFKRYYNGGILQAEMNFLSDGKTAYAKLYYQNGKVAAEGKYVNMKKDSTWKYYSFYNGRHAISENYNMDRRHGITRKFYDNAGLAEEKAWVNDTLHGL